MDLPITEPILQFTALVIIALVVQLVFERMHLPGIVGLLVIGALVGPHGLGALPRGEVMELLGRVGLVYVMFVAGLEIDLDVFQTRRQETVAFGLLAFGLSLVPAVAVGLLLGFELRSALLLGTLLSSHTLLAYPIVAQLGLVHRPAIVAVIGGTLLTDTLALVLLAVVIESGKGMLALAQPLLLLAVLVTVSLWLVPRTADCFLGLARVRRAEKALLVLAVLLLLAAISELIGTHEILGAFLAGICLNRVLERRHDLQEHVEFAGRMLFIPFFFISTGMRLEMEVLASQWHVWMLAGLMLALVLAGKLAAAWLSGWWYGYPWPERVVMVGLTIPQAAATLAVTVTAAEIGLFDEEVVDAVILLIFATCVAGPLVTRSAGKRARREMPGS